MANLDQLPPAPDLPPDRHGRMRARVLAAIAEPAAHRRTLASRRPVRIVAAGLATAACAAIAWVGIGGPSGSSQEPQVYALGDTVLSPSARKAGRDCLKSARDRAATLSEQMRKTLNDPLTEPWPADSPPRLLNHVEQQGRGALAVYQMQSQLIHCEMSPLVKFGPAPREYADDGGWAFGISSVDSSRLLPGPISSEFATSTDRKGGYLEVSGRVSERVARVVLDDGAGHQSTARLAQGTFIVFSDERVKITDAAMLISYDASGREIDRRQAFIQTDGRCFTDPAGNLVFPTSDDRFDADTVNKAQCEPAESWSRPSSTSTQRTPQ